MCEKNYDLLRPFDLDKFKAGDLVVWSLEIDEEVETGKFVAGPDCNRGICILWDKDSGLQTYDDTEQTEFLRMAPLAWVEGKPVYKEDVLYDWWRGSRIVVGVAGEYLKLVTRKGEPWSLLHQSTISWTPPKPKTKQLTMFAYLDTRSGYLTWNTSECLEQMRVPSEDKTIEVEE